MAELRVNPEPKDIRWQDATSYLLFNPRTDDKNKEIYLRLVDVVQTYPSYFWLMTSGSQAFPKAVGLKKTAVLTAAKALSEAYDFRAEENWLCCLPHFHIGGLSIWARAEVAKQNVILGEWQKDNLKELFSQETIHWCSLVPTQVFDVLKAKLKAPKSLRGVFVGGGALSSELDEEARAQGWPILTTYGMTEASSQIATRRRADEELKPLPHLELHSDPAKRLGIKGPSVVDQMATWNGEKWTLEDPRDAKQIYWTQDLVEIKNDRLVVLGRQDDLKKTRGELVSQSQLQARLETCLKELKLGQQAVVFFQPDDRLENRICLAIEANIWASSKSLVQSFNQHSLPYERIESVYILKKIPRSDLGKVQYARLSGL